ncbi:hypothetical protein OIU91_19705 [Streptomyces sp. NBC_01456]|uniref:hypothetical protein n=1 Tax=Streptomyces sp. NBC_01456 TaxID=2975868 RepID=UPI002E3164A7|nr:hypothetical protein [Streptomyces sp. NBC_01456]
MTSPARGEGELLDAVALAYADDPAEVEPLLLELADAAGRAAYMATYPTATDYGRASAAAAADAARDELLAVLDPTPQKGAAA